METKSDNKLPPQSGCKPKTLIRPKKRSIIPASSSSKLTEVMQKKISVKEDHSGDISSDKVRKTDIRMLDPININAFLKEMDRREKAMYEKFKGPDSTDHSANFSYQQRGSGPSTSCGHARSDVRIFDMLEAKKNALEELVHGYDSFMGEAVAHAEQFRNRGDICTAALLDIIKGIQMTSSIAHKDMKNKAAPTPSPRASVSSTSRGRHVKKLLMKKMQAKKMELLHDIDSVEDTPTHDDSIERQIIKKE